jgi:hypothetical protein
MWPQEQLDGRWIARAAASAASFAPATPALPDRPRWVDRASDVVAVPLALAEGR